MHSQNHTYSQLGTWNFKIEKGDAFQFNKKRHTTGIGKGLRAEADPGIKKIYIF